MVQFKETILNTKNLLNQNFYFFISLPPEAAVPVEADAGAEDNLVHEPERRDLQTNQWKFSKINIYLF